MSATTLPQQVSTLPALLAEKEALVHTLQAEVAQLKLLNALAQEIGLVASEAELYRITAQHTARLFPTCGRSSIALLDPSATTLHIYALEGHVASIPMGMGLPADRTLVGRTVRERRALMMDGAEFEASTLIDMQSLRKSGLCAALTAPLISGGQVIGTLNAAASIPKAFAAEHLLLIQKVAALVASHVDRWRLLVALQASLQKTQQHEQQLQIDLTERARAEQERIALQAQIIEAQQRRLKEMSTPLIPISDSVMVLPLIGTMDAARAQQVLETVLQGAQQRRAAIIIIDITGMQQVDSYAASSLINAAKALRLLGCKTLLSGVRAEVAQTLVGLGIDLDSIMTRGSLQSAISYALAKSAA